jgi:ParB-like chromosome segregation protein Spo0J
MEAHEYAELFPMATDAEVQEIAADIQKRGLLCPIITLDGKVLDGRNRLRACEIAGVTPHFQKYSGADPLADVVTWNLKRRHLTPSQQAGIGADVANMQRGGDGSNQYESKPAHVPVCKVSQAEAAKMVGVSERLLRDAVKVKNAAPELHEEVKAGRMTVPAAKKEVKQREEQKHKPVISKKQAEAMKPRVGLKYASLAIGNLEQIKDNDEERGEAFALVKGWITDHEA